MNSNKIPLTLCYSTSYDVEHPPSNAIEDSETTFWMTTGLFPQEICFSFKNPSKIVRITTITAKAKYVFVYAATNPELTEFTEIDSFNLPGNPSKQQETHQLNINIISYGIKVCITSGWGPFCAVYLVKVEGNEIM